jgi:integrase
LKERDPETHDFAMLSLFTGLRAGECSALTWADVDMEGGRIFVKDTKNKRNRHAFITDEVRVMLSARAAGQGKAERVFPGPKGGNGFNRHWHSFSQAVKALGLNDGVSDRRQRLVLHSLRHSFASWLVMKGTPLYTVSKLMGHSSIRMTERYAHLAPDTQRAAAMELEGIFSQ